MTGNAGKGRARGSRNKRTEALLALAADGESPAVFGLRIMRDEGASLEQRLQAARIAAPYVHARPAPNARPVSIDLPDSDTVEGLCHATAAVLRAVAQGKISANAGRDLVEVLEFQHTSIKRLEDRRRLERYEREQLERAKRALAAVPNRAPSPLPGPPAQTPADT